MYERANPFSEYVAGGRLDMTECDYEQVEEEPHASPARASSRPRTSG